MTQDIRYQPRSPKLNPMLGPPPALRAGWQVLAADGAALDAVTAAVTVLENDPLFNAAHGAVFSEIETLEMDAAVIRGHDRAAGGWRDRRAGPAIQFIRHVSRLRGR